MSKGTNAKDEAESEKNKKSSCISQKVVLPLQHKNKQSQKPLKKMAKQKSIKPLANKYNRQTITVPATSVVDAGKNIKSSLNESVIENLKTSILQNGYDTASPIRGYRDSEGGNINLLDGHHRLFALQSLANENLINLDEINLTVNVYDFNGLSEVDKELAILELQRDTDVLDDPTKGFVKIVDLANKVVALFNKDVSIEKIQAALHFGNELYVHKLKMLGTKGFKETMKQLDRLPQSRAMSTLMTVVAAKETDAKNASAVKAIADAYEAKIANETALAKEIEARDLIADQVKNIKAEINKADTSLKSKEKALTAKETSLKTAKGAEKASLKAEIATLTAEIKELKEAQKVREASHTKAISDSEKITKNIEKLQDAKKAIKAASKDAKPTKTTDKPATTQAAETSGTFSAIGYLPKTLKYMLEVYEKTPPVFNDRTFTFLKTLLACKNDGEMNDLMLAYFDGLAPAVGATSGKRSDLMDIAEDRFNKIPTGDFGDENVWIDLIVDTMTGSDGNGVAPETDDEPTAKELAEADRLANQILSNDDDGFDDQVPEVIQ